MRLTVQKKLAGSILGCSPKRIWCNPARLEEIKEAITRNDIKALIHKGLLQEKIAKVNSRGRARKIHHQKIRGMRRGHGSRKGRNTARSPEKREWINRIRLQRQLLAELKERKLVDNTIYNELYTKASGGFFRSKRHLQLYIDERKLVKRNEEKKHR